MISRQAEVTQLLSSWRSGDSDALDKVSEIVYAELKRLAHSHMAKERLAHTLQTTALVGEAFIRIVDADIDYQSRNHFMVIAARMMRRILIDHARSRQRQKRGDGLQRVTLNEALDGYAAPSADILSLDESLTRLAEFDETKATIIECQYFAGLSSAQMAEFLGLSKRTVEREAQLARAWLQMQLS
jgi:RNA polymerase sigma factor (TIGR02999 family)